MKQEERLRPQRPCPCDPCPVTPPHEALPTRPCPCDPLPRRKTAPRPQGLGQGHGEMLAPSGFSRVGAWQRVADVAALCTGQCFWVLRAVLGVLLKFPRGANNFLSAL